jgi:MFS family permease
MNLSPRIRALIVSLIQGTATGITFATYAPFLRENGLSHTQANLCNACYFITNAVLEIPTGILADHFGRRRCLLISYVLGTIGALVYGSSHTVLGFIASEIILAGSASLAGSTLESWLTESQAHHGIPEVQADRAQGHLQVVRQLSLVLVPFLGTLAWSHDKAYPWFIMAGLQALAFVLALVLLDNSGDSKPKHRLTLHQLQESCLVATKLPQVQLILLIGGGITFGISGANMQWQEHFTQLTGTKDSIAWIGGFLIGGGHVIGSLLSNLLFEKIPTRWLLILLPLLSGVFLLIASLPAIVPALTGFLFYEILIGSRKAIFTRATNECAEAGNRTTVQSLKNMPSHLAGALGLLINGLITDRSSILHGWIFASVCFMLVACAGFIISRPRKG